MKKSKVRDCLDAIEQLLSQFESPELHLMTPFAGDGFDGNVQRIQSVLERSPTTIARNIEEVRKAYAKLPYETFANIPE